MSDSDDEVPLGQRKAPAAGPAIKTEPVKPAQKTAAQPTEPAPRARKAPIVDDSDSDDEPLARKPVAAKPKPKMPASVDKPSSDKKAPRSEAERALTKNESAVKRAVELEEKVQEEKRQHKQQAAAKHKTTPKHKGGKAAKGGKAENGVEKVKREKKVYDLPGQTKDTPDETDSLRKFYSSLRTQRPDSLMARKWLCQHGLLPREEAEELVAEVAKEKAAGKPRSPSKPRPRPAANGSAAPKKAPARPRPDKVTGQKRKVGRPPHPVKKNRKIAKKDDAFTDGGLVPSSAPAVKPAASDASDDDDLPLAARAAAKAR